MTNEEQIETTETERDSGCNCALTLIRDGQEQPERFEFNRSVIIGRADPTLGPVDIDLSSIPEGQFVSRRHAEIACEDGCCTLRDLGSSNGTKVLSETGDFVPVQSDYPLQSGEQVMFGQAVFSFELTPEMSPMEDPEESTEP